MVFKVTDLVRQQKTIRHKLVINWKESLQPTYDYTEDVFLCEMVHQRITVENASSHFDDVQVMIPKSHAIPQNGPIARLICLSVSVLANHVLNRIQLGPTMVGVDYDLRSSDFALFISIH